MKKNQIFVFILLIATAFADVIETPVLECSFDKDQCNGFPLTDFEPGKFEFAKSILINPVTNISLSDYTSISAPTENGLTCEIPYSLNGRNHFYCQARPEFDCITKNGDLAKCADGRFLLARIANESTQTNWTFIINPKVLPEGQYNVRFRLFFFCDGVTTNCILAKEYIGVTVNNVFYKYNNSQSNTVSQWKPQIIPVDLKISSIKIILNFVREMTQISVRSFLGFDDLVITRLDPATTTTTTTTTTATTTTTTTMETTSRNSSTDTPNLTQTTTEATLNTTKKIDDNQTGGSKLKGWQIALIVLGILIFIGAIFVIKFRKIISEKLKKCRKRPNSPTSSPTPTPTSSPTPTPTPTPQSPRKTDEVVLNPIIQNNSPDIMKNDSITNLLINAERIRKEIPEKGFIQKGNTNHKQSKKEPEAPYPDPIPIFQNKEKNFIDKKNNKHHNQDHGTQNIESSGVDNVKNE